MVYVVIIIIVHLQLKVLAMPDGTRYSPLKDISNGGIILMKDVKPGEKEEIVETVVGKCR